jgi:hypothetical protein
MAETIALAKLVVEGKHMKALLCRHEQEPCINSTCVWVDIVNLTIQLLSPSLREMNLRMKL